jgi:uncharacterized paraquat-inducible protein A
MSVIDGGSFKCYETNDKTMHYETVDPAAWEEHKKGHNTNSGSTSCVVCGNQTPISHLPMDKKAVCDKCKEDLK